VRREKKKNNKTFAGRKQQNNNNKKQNNEKHKRRQTSQQIKQNKNKENKQRWALRTPVTKNSKKKPLSKNTHQKRRNEHPRTCDESEVHLTVEAWFVTATIFNLLRWTFHKALIGS
jgi:hypothetical protein